MVLESCPGAEADVGRYERRGGEDRGLGECPFDNQSFRLTMRTAG